MEWSMVLEWLLDNMNFDAWQTVYHTHMHVMGGEQLDVPIYCYAWVRLGGQCPAES